MRKESVRTRARTKGRKLPYQRDKLHFTEKTGVPDLYRVRTDAYRARAGFLVLSKFCRLRVVEGKVGG